MSRALAHIIIYMVDNYLTLSNIFFCHKVLRVKNNHNLCEN